MQKEVAEQILDILMESGLYRSEELALEALENGSDQWIKDLEEEASSAAIVSLQKSLEDALKNKDFKRVREIREKIKSIASN